MPRSAFEAGLRRVAQEAARQRTEGAIKVLTTEPRPLPPLTPEEAALLEKARELLRRPTGHWEPYGPDDDPWEFNIGGRWGNWVAEPPTAEEREIIERATALSRERDRLAWGEE